MPESVAVQPVYSPRQFVYLAYRNDRPLSGALPPSVGQQAGVLGDKLVGRRRGHHGVQKPVGLGGRRGARAIGGHEAGVPGPHEARRELADVDVPELREDVQAEKVLVEAPGAGSEAGMFLDPGVGTDHSPRRTPAELQNS